jgi:hypothetical protein
MRSGGGRRSRTGGSSSCFPPSSPSSRCGAAAAPERSVVAGQGGFGWVAALYPDSRSSPPSLVAVRFVEASSGRRLRRPLSRPISK